MNPQRPGLRILIVDAFADAASALAFLLTAYGHEVVVAGDGRAALNVAEAFDPDVIILELDLPEVDGFEVARRVRARGGGGRPLLVALTAYTTSETSDRCAVAGIDVHLLKPVLGASLEAALREFQLAAERRSAGQ